MVSYGRLAGDNNPFFMHVNKYFSKFGSYYAFLIKYYSKEYEVRLTSEEENIIEFLSKKVTNMKRIHELALLHQLLKQQRRLFTYYKKILETIYHKQLNLQTEESVVRNLTNECTEHWRVFL